MDNPQKIICGRFDSVVDISGARARKYKDVFRIGSKKPSSIHRKVYTPIATDGSVVLYNCEIYPVREFLAGIGRQHKTSLIVLTIKEHRLMLDKAVDFGVKIEVFEAIYPIFRNIKFASTPQGNYSELKRLLNKIKSLGLNGLSPGHLFSTNQLYKIERALRFKNGLDYYFAFAQGGGYQEVFKLKEEREDRVVVAFDFNSMYASCLNGEFSEPKSIIYRDFRGGDTSAGNLESGLYRVVLKGPKKGFFRSSHPFKYKLLNNSFYFELDDNHEIEVLLFKNEILCYQKYFESVEVLEGLCTSKTVSHPLARRAQKIYDARKKYAENNNSVMHDVSKFELLTMHGSTNKIRYKAMHFKDAKEAASYLEKKYMVGFSDGMPPSKKIELIQDGKYFIFGELNEGIAAKLIDFDAKDLVISLSAQIIANSRVKMIETIERFLSHNSVELCYSNVDSLHISILKSELNKFLSYNADYISDDIGGLKIQAIADKGYWFDIGRYWLKKNGAVTLFKNKIFNHKANTKEFSRFRLVKFVYSGNLFHYVKTRLLRIENSFSFSKKLEPKGGIDTLNYFRYSFGEIQDLNVAGDSYNKETLRSKRIKIDLFDKIATA
jgi:hypothetical protein